MSEELDLDKIIRRVCKELEEENRGIGGMNSPGGSEVSDTVRAQQKAAYEASEPPKKKLAPKRKTGGKPIAPGIIAFDNLEDAMKALKDFQEKGGQGCVVSGENIEPEDYAMPKEEEGRLRELLRELRKFCEKWNLPAICQVQQWRKGDHIAVAGFHHIDPLRAFGRMLILDEALQVLFHDDISGEEADALALMLMQIHQRHKGDK